MKQKILVLGAGGFIGRRVAAALSASDWATPIAAGRRPVAGAESGSLQLDATDQAQLERAVEGVAGVVNCVAGDTRTFVAGAQALAEVVSRGPQLKVVHLSSMAVYGDREGDVGETAPLGAGLSPYGAAKLEAERLLNTNSVAILRLGIVYGPGSSQWSGRIAQLLHAHRLGDLGSAGDGCCNLLFIADAVEAICRALKVPAAGGKTYNVAGASLPTWNEYFSRFALALGAVPVARISRRRLRIEAKALAPPLKIAEIIAGKLSPRLSRALPQPIPPSLVRLFAQEIRMTVACIERDLGMTWTSMESGLENAAEWYRAREA